MGTIGTNKNVTLKLDEPSVIIGATETKNVVDVIQNFKRTITQTFPPTTPPPTHPPAPPTRFDLVLLSPTIVVPEKRPSIVVAANLRNRASPTRRAFGPNRGIVFFCSKVSLFKGVNSEPDINLSLTGGGVKSLGRSDFESGVTNVAINATVKDGETSCDINQIEVAMTTDFVEAIRCCSSNLKIDPKAEDANSNSTSQHPPTPQQQYSNQPISFPQFTLTLQSFSLTLSSLRFEMKSIHLKTSKTKLASSVEKVICFNGLSGINFFQRTNTTTNTDSSNSPLISVNVDRSTTTMEVNANVQPFAVVLCVECVEEVVNFARNISPFEETEQPLRIETEDEPEPKQAEVRSREK